GASPRMGSRRLLGTASHQQREGAAAETAQNESLILQGAQALRDQRKQRVAGGMPAQIVHPLEMVEVEHQQRAAIGIIVFQQMLQTSMQEMPVGQVRQRIEERHVV